MHFGWNVRVQIPKNLRQTQFNLFRLKTSGWAANRYKTQTAHIAHIALTVYTCEPLFCLSSYGIYVKNHYNPFHFQFQCVSTDNFCCWRIFLGFSQFFFFSVWFYVFVYVSGGCDVKKMFHKYSNWRNRTLC